MRIRATGLALGLALSLLPASAWARDKPVSPRGLPPAAHAEQGEEHDSLIQRYEFFHKQRAFPNGIPRGARARAVRQSERLPHAGPMPAAGSNLESPSAPFSALPTAAFDWALLGPRPIGDPRNEDVSDPWSGRVNAIAPDPDNPTTVYLGAASGGVWKTVNNGGSWKPLTDDLDSLAVGALAVQPGSTGVVILGTGEPNFSLDSYYGTGIYVSGDGGGTWDKAATDVSADGCHFTDVIFDPADPTNVLASALSWGDGPGCANPGVYRSTDSGQNWTQVVSGQISDLDVDPTDPTKWYAAVEGDGIYHMDETGTLGTKLTINGVSSIDRIAMAISPTDPNRMYAAFTSAAAGDFVAAGSGIFTTSTGPDGTWSAFSTGTGYKSTSVFAFPWYALKLLVDPANPSTLLVGSGPYLVRFTGAGSSMDFPTFAGGPDRAHADYHALALAGSRLWIGNDGGVYSTDDNFATIQNRNANLTLTQFDPGGTVGSGGVAVGGTQDNGTLKTGTVLDWQRVMGCDGGWSAVNPNDGQDIVLTTQSGCAGHYVMRTTNGGATAPVNAQSGITTSEAGLFYSPVVQSPTDPTRLWYGRTHLWTSSNRGTSWTVYGSTQTYSSANISAIGASSDPNTVYVGTTNGHIWSTSSGAAGTWTDTNIGRYVTSITVDPSTPGTAYASVSGFGANHLYKTVNSGVNWTPILPTSALDSPANGVAVDWRAGKGQIYVATDVGVIESADGGTTWLDGTPGMPRAVAQNVVVDTSMDRLVVFTHGRGVWAAALGTNPPDTSISGGPSNGISDSSVSFVLSATPSGGATFQCKMDDEPFETCSANPQYTGLDDGAHTFQARAISSGGSDQSPAFNNFTVDTTAPDTFIDTAPVDGNTGPAVFAFSSDEPGSTFECDLDSAGFQPCAASTAFPVASGTHDLSVRARDNAGNVDGSPAAANWFEAATPAPAPPPATTTTPVPTGTTPTGTPPPSGTQATTAISGRLGAVKSLSLKALTKGLRLSFTCGRDCTVNLTLANGKKILLRAKATLATAGTGRVRLKASRKAAKALQKLIGKKLTLTASFSGTGATPERRTAKLKLKR